MLDEYRHRGRRVLVRDTLNGAERMGTVDRTLPTFGGGEVHEVDFGEIAAVDDPRFGPPRPAMRDVRRLSSREVALFVDEPPPAHPQGCACWLGDER